MAFQADENPWGDMTQVIDPALLDNEGTSAAIDDPFPLGGLAPPSEPQPSAAQTELDNLFGDTKESDEESAAGTPLSEPGEDADGHANGDVDGDAEKEAADGLTSPERRRRKHLEYEEESDAGDADGLIQQTEANVAIPKLPLPHSSENKYWMLHLPGYMRIDPKPFDPLTYVGPEIQDEETGREPKDKSALIQLEVNSTLRWKWSKAEDGSMQRVSNSRVVRWSDGSLSLQLGSELFDLVSHTSDGTPTHPSAVPPTATATSSTTFLVSQHPRAQILQSTRSLSGTLNVRPSDMQSEAHRALVRAVGQKHSKVARLLMAPDPVRDPEKEAKELLKRESRGVAKRRVRERGEGGGGGGGAARKRQRRGRREEMWSDEEEEEYVGEEEEDTPGRRGRTFGGRPKAQPKEGKRAGSYEEDDFVVKDTDEEDEGEGGEEVAEKKEKRGTKRTRARAEKVEGKDDMEEAEDILEEELKVRRRAKAARAKKEPPTPTKKETEKKKGEDEDADGEADMEVDEAEPAKKVEVGKDEEMESEDEEEADVGVRRAGAGGRRRVVVEEDEE